MLLGLDRVAMAGNGEEAMYKELYENLSSIVDKLMSHALSGDVSIPEVVSAPKIYCVFNNNTAFNLTLPNITYVEAGAFASSGGLRELNLPKVTGLGYYPFLSSSGITKIRLPKCVSIVSSSFQGVSGCDIYLDAVAHTASGFPWGCTNASTVFHCSDGDYDYQGNPVSS